jgi:hypothetical protein
LANPVGCLQILGKSGAGKARLWAPVYAVLKEIGP